MDDTTHGGRVSPSEKQAIRRLIRSEGRAYGWDARAVKNAVRMANLDMGRNLGGTVAVPAGPGEVRRRTFAQAARMGSVLTRRRAA